MIKIPNSEGKFSIPNNSDKFGNLHYVKNINFDEEGYIKLSSRAVSLVNDQDNTDFNIPVALGRAQSDIFKVITTEKPFDVQLNESAGVTAAQDTDNGDDAPPTLTFDSHGKWWQNRWYATEDQLLVYKTIFNGNWTDTAVALSTGKNHFLEVFKNRETLCIANGNAVIQINTSHSTSGGQLSIPADFEIIGLAYNNTKMAVATRMSDTVAGQNQEAILFIWSGTSSQAGQGFGVGSDAIMTVFPYKSSFAIITRTGQLKYFNGAGFEEMASLPFYFQNITWGDSQNPEMFGDTVQVDGDVVYINLNNEYERFGIKGEEYLPETPGGVWCYDPKVGLYHRNAPSISEVSSLTVTSGNIDTGTNILTKTAGTIPATGNPIKYIYNRDTQIGGLQTGTVYYVIKLSSSTFKLATSKENALNGTAIDITSTGDTDNYFLALDVTDYAQTYIGRTGAIGMVERQTHVCESLLFGSELSRIDSSTTDAHLNFLCSGFRNIGYVKTPKITSQQVKDSYGKLFINHRPLKTGDKIIIKEKHVDVLGLPVTTPQDSASINWTSNKEFYTTADLSEALAYLNNNNGKELECEIIAGAGAGQMSQIESMAEDDGTYSVVLVDEIDGAVSGRVGDILIENWKLLDTITPENDTGTKEIPLDAKSKFSEYKIILDGVDVVIEDISIPNKTYKPIA